MTERGTAVKPIKICKLAIKDLEQMLQIQEI
jgi:hypothetical protein